MPSYYVERLKRSVTLCQQHALLKPGDRALELGTSWVHWEALLLRIFFDVTAVLYDVWDNRQSEALRSYASQLSVELASGGLGDGLDASSAIDLCKRINQTSSLEEVYQLLGFEYVVDPDGMMERLPHS